MEVNSTRE